MCFILKSTVHVWSQNPTWTELICGVFHYNIQELHWKLRILRYFDCTFGSFLSSCQKGYFTGIERMRQAQLHCLSECGLHLERS